MSSSFANEQQALVVLPITSGIFQAPYKCNFQTKASSAGTLLAGVRDAIEQKVVTDHLFIHPNQTKVCKNLHASGSHAGTGAKPKHC
jgi:hypothetical protein